jgi:hypothetical protein
MSVTCSISLFERLLFVARNPFAVSAQPGFACASSRAWASNATAPISASTLRFDPASSCCDSCRSLNSIAGMPEGV